MAIKHNIEKAQEVGRILYKCFNDPTRGIFGRTVMPEDALPKGVARGSYEHRMFITLTVSIDYQRDANLLWEASRETFENESTRYLFFPEFVYGAPLPKLQEDMQKYKLSKKPRQDSWIWTTNAVSFLKKWKGDPLNLIHFVSFDSLRLIERIKGDKHLRGNRLVYDFPFLRGNKIAPLWVRMLRDNVGLQLKNIDRIPIPVDRHIARATQMCGALTGNFQEDLPPFGEVQAIWREATIGTNLVALDFDEPLWHLSKYGCSRSSYAHCPMKVQCPVSNYCIISKSYP